TRLWGLIGSLTLMLSFEAYIAWMKIMEIQTGMRLPCTCGGIVSQMGWTTHLYFNGIFILLLSLSIYFLQTWKKHQTLRSEEHTSELQSRENLVCRLLLEK